MSMRSLITKGLQFHALAKSHHLWRKYHDETHDGGNSGSGKHHSGSGVSATSQTTAAPAQQLQYKAAAERNVALIGCLLFFGGFLCGYLVRFWQTKLRDNVEREEVADLKEEADDATHSGPWQIT